MNNPYKVFFYLLIITLPAVFFSCSKEDDVILKSGNQIIATSVQTNYPTGSGSNVTTPKEYEGNINQDAGTIFYDIPGNADVDITKLLIKVSLPVEASITPGLRGYKDLSIPLEIIVTAGNGMKKIYRLQARYVNEEI